MATEHDLAADSRGKRGSRSHRARRGSCPGRRRPAAACGRRRGSRGNRKDKHREIARGVCLSGSLSIHTARSAADRGSATRRAGRMPASNASIGGTRAIRGEIGAMRAASLVARCRWRVRRSSQLRCNPCQPRKSAARSSSALSVQSAAAGRELVVTSGCPIGSAAP